MKYTYSLKKDRAGSVTVIEGTVISHKDKVTDSIASTTIICNVPSLKEAQKRLVQKQEDDLMYMFVAYPDVFKLIAASIDIAIERGSGYVDLLPLLNDLDIPSYDLPLSYGERNKLIKAAGEYCGYVMTGVLSDNNRRVLYLYISVDTDTLEDKLANSIRDITYEVIEDNK